MKTLIGNDTLVYEPPDLGCILYLPGLPGGGNRIHDRSPYGNHGIITGAVWVRLPSGLWCLSFDGVDDSVVCGTSASCSFEYNQPFTLKAWAKTTLDNTNQFIISKQLNSGNYTGYNLYILNTNKLQAGLNETASVWAGRRGTTVLNDSKYHHLVSTYNGNGLASGILLYVDGNLEAMSTVNNNLTGATIINNATPCIGARQNAGVPFRGYIGNAEIYNRVLSALEIRDGFNREKSLFGVW